jgi:hypothetical protein
MEAKAFLDPERVQKSSRAVEAPGIRADHTIDSEGVAPIFHALPGLLGS